MVEAVGGQIEMVHQPSPFNHPKKHSLYRSDLLFIHNFKCEVSTLSYSQTEYQVVGSIPPSPLRHIFT